MPAVSPPETDRPTAAELRAKLQEAGDALRELRETPDSDRGDTYVDDVRSAIDIIHTLDGELTAAERSEQRAPESRGPRSHLIEEEREWRSVGDRVVESDEYEARHARGGTWAVDIGASSELRTLVTSDTGAGGGGLLRPVAQPIMLPPEQNPSQAWVRDLLSVQGTNLAAIPYIQEQDQELLAGFTNDQTQPADANRGAKMVPEGEQKPEVSIAFVDADAPVRKVAAWIPVTQEILEDAPSLSGYINTRLSWMLRVRETQQILNGSGTAPQLRGVRQTVGIQQQAFTDDELTTLGLAIGKVENVDGQASGLVINPTDYWQMATKRNDTSGLFDAGSPWSSIPQSPWGLRTVRTRVMPTGTALVADWAQGATVFDRKQTTIRTSDSHDTYFTENKLAILAEARLALAVWRPHLFVEVTLTAGAG